MYKHNKASRFTQLLLSFYDNFHSTQFASAVHMTTLLHLNGVNIVVEPQKRTHHPLTWMDAMVVNYLWIQFAVNKATIKNVYMKKGVSTIKIEVCLTAMCSILFHEIVSHLHLIFHVEYFLFQIRSRCSLLVETTALKW